MFISSVKFGVLTQLDTMMTDSLLEPQEAIQIYLH